MSLLDRLLREPSCNWVFEQLSDDNCPFDSNGTEVRAESAYISVTLRSMRIVNARHLSRRFYAVVHSTCSLIHQRGEFPVQTIITPWALREIDSDRLDRVIQINQPLVSNMPFRGGSLDMELGLFSVQCADLTAPFISLLESLSKAAGVTMLSNIQPFVDPIKAGIGALTGEVGMTTLELGLKTTIKPFSNRWYLVARTPSQSLDISTLRLSPSDYSLCRSNNAPIDFPYFVFSTEASDHRRDWYRIPEVNESYDRIKSVLQTKDIERTREALATFRLAAATSPNLLWHDGERIAEEITTQVESTLAKLPLNKRSMKNQVELPSLEEIQVF